MINHIRMGIYRVIRGSYEEFLDQAQQRMAPFHRDSPGFVSYTLTDVGDGRFVSVSAWETREQAEAATSRTAEWIKSANLTDSVALEENLIGEMTTLAATNRHAV